MKGALEPDISIALRPDISIVVQQRAKRLLDSKARREDHRLSYGNETPSLREDQ